LVTSQDLSDAGASDRANIDGEAPLRFGRFAVLPQSRQLFMDGQVCEIGGRAFDLLMVLIDRRGEVVSKREIIDLVWPDTYVDDVNLRVQIVTLRRALGADRDMVKAVPGRGYLFDTEVSAMYGKSDGGEPLVEGAEPDLAAARINFTRPTHALLGRAAELAELETMIGKSRMVTLTGCGGVGKTRLAIELGLRLASSFPDRVSLIDLAPLRDGASIISTTAAVLGVEIRSLETAVEAIAGAIGQRQLLIFDNCEHLAGDATGFIAALLDRAPGLAVLATSQEPLHHPSGSRYRLEPLAVPPLGAVEISTYAATELFCERARLADRRFMVTASNTGQVAQICRRLDGIPLALEMAAARLPLLGIEGLLGALDARLKVLKTPAHIDDARHQTLRSMVEWSHGLLDTDERRVFRRLAIFPSSFSLEAAADVAGEKGEDHWDLVDTLGRLVEKSLMTVEGNDPPRYRLLETLRLFAREQLTASGEYEVIAERHAQFFADLFVAAYDLLEQVQTLQWLQRYSPELDSVRAALAWGLASPDHKNIVVRLAGASSTLYWLSARASEGICGLDQAVLLIDDETPPRDAARLHERIGSINQNIDNSRSRAAYEQAVIFCRKLDDKPRLASILSSLGVNLARSGRSEEAKLMLDEALQILSATDNKAALFAITARLGLLARLGGDNAGARGHCERALDLAREFGDDFREVYLMGTLAEIEFEEGSVDRAIALAREATTRLRTNKAHGVLRHMMINFASYLAFGVDPSEARVYAEEALLAQRDTGGELLRCCLQLWALLAALDGQYSEAARLIGYVDAASAEAGDVRESTEKRIYERLMAILDAKTPAANRDRCTAEGAGWNEKRAVEFTINHVIPGPSVPN